MTRSTRALRVHAAVCAALMLGASSAGAMTSSARLQDFTISVEDLDLNDGVQAGYSFSFLSQFALASVQAFPNPVDAPRFGDDWGDISSSATSGSNTAQAQGSAGFLSVMGSGSYAAIAHRRAQFTLAPNTRLVFTGRATVSAAIDTLACEPLCAISTATVHITDFASGLDGLFSLGATVRGPVDDLTESHTQSFSFALDNATSSSGTRALFIGLETSSSISQPIPEPSAYALMLAGLGCFAAVARRRRRPG